jgi:hypothetical protein
MQSHEIAEKKGVRLGSGRLPALTTETLIILGLLAIVVTFVCGRLILYAFREMEAVVTRIPDDTGYFYKIALNVALGKGLTFDGINQTNGFQPLWLYMLLPLAWAMREAPVDLYLRAALIYQLSLVAIAGVVFFFAMLLYSRRSVALTATTLFYIFGIGHFANGMETGILVLCLSALLYFSLKYRPFSDSSTSKHAFVFGLLLGLTVLARLDMVFLLAVIYTFILWQAFAKTERAGRARLGKQLLLSVIAFTLVTAPYFVYNKIHFGAIMPISGQLKNSFPYILQPNFGADRFPSLVMLIFSLIFVSSLISILLFLRSRAASTEQDGYKFTVLLIGSLYVSVHYLHTALFMKWAVFGWHFAFYFLHACVLFAYILDRFLSHIPAFALRPVAAIVIIALFGVLVGRTYRAATTQPRGWQPHSYRASVWARNNLPPDARLALKDAGLFGLLSERSVVNLDGLVNNLEYQEYLRRKRLNDYFRQKGIQYLVVHAYWSDAPKYKEFVSATYTHLDIPYRSQLHDTFSDPIRVYREDEVYRSPLYYDNQHKTAFVIWRLRL